jgi:hypothetical protein
MEEGIPDKLEGVKPLIEETDVACGCVARNFWNRSTRSNTREVVSCGYTQSIPEPIGTGATKE